MSWRECVAVFSLFDDVEGANTRRVVEKLTVMGGAGVDGRIDAKAELPPEVSALSSNVSSANNAYLVHSKST